MRAGSSAEPRSTSRPAASSATGSATERGRRRGDHQQGATRRRAPRGRRSRTLAAPRSVRASTVRRAHGAAPDVTGTPAGARRPPTPPADAPLVRPPRRRQQLRPRRHLRPAAQQRAALPLGHPAPHPELDSGGPARARGTRCAPDTSGRSRAPRAGAPPSRTDPSASAVRHRAAARQFRLPAIRCSRLVVDPSGKAGRHRQTDPVSARFHRTPGRSTQSPYRSWPTARTTAARVPWSIVKPPRHLLRPVGLLLALCLLAGVLVAGMAFPGCARARDWCPTTRATA